MKELSTILEIPETCPPDFYKNPAYLDQVKTALETAQSLVHSIDDEGEKKAKADAAAIRKFVKTTNGFTKTVFDSMTGKIKAWRDGFTTETKKLEIAADDILNKFEEKRKKELSFIESVVMAELTSQRTLAQVGEAFITRPDLSPIIKLSGTLTPKQALTSGARKFISDIVYSEKAAEQQYHARLAAVKLKCLENEINPPLSDEYFGSSFYGSDEEFDSKLEQLVAIELRRRQETIAKLAKQKEIDEQAAIDRALKKEHESRLFQVFWFQ